MRPNIYEEYLKSQAEFLSRTKGITLEAAETFVKQISKDRLKPPKLTALVCERPGYEVKKQIEFSDYSAISKTNIITPNGRVYIDPRVRPSRMRSYIIDLLKKRAYHKGRMFEFQQKNMYESAAMERVFESKIKIAMNTITGGAKNSPYSCFYDKAGFNAVTSVARLMIKTNYSIYEQVLGGNFFWENCDELINNIILQLRHLPEKDKLIHLIEKYNLYQPTKEELMDRYQFFMNLYEVGPTYLHRKEFVAFRSNLDKGSHSNLYMSINNDTIRLMLELSQLNKAPEEIVDLSKVRTLVQNLEQHEVTFLYYVNNLRSLFWKNSKTFKPILAELISDVMIQMEDHNLQDIFKLDGNLPPIISTKYAHLVVGKELKDIVVQEPEIAKILVNYAHHLFKKFSAIEDVVYMFCKTPIGVTRTNIKEKMWRNVTLGSDTDSVLYTLKEWVKWFSGDAFDKSSDSDVIQAVMTYYVAKVAGHNMMLLSEHLGATGDDRFILKMKGEFDFQTMTFYHIKKHYTGVIDKQEGRVLPKVKLEIKGLGLRGSSIPTGVSNILEEFVLATRQRQHASYFIRRVTEYEHEMANDLRAGSHQFLKPLSIRTEDAYAKAESSNYLYYQFWNFVFGPKYGEVQAPLKCPSVFLLPFDSDVMHNIKHIDKDIYLRIQQFMTKFGKKKMSSVIINPILHKVPEEVIVMMDMRKHIFSNMKPLYLSLESYGIFMSHFQENSLILSDYYDELKIRFTEYEEQHNEAWTEEKL